MYRNCAPRACRQGWSAVRLRLLISAAIAAVATYTALVRDDERLMPAGPRSDHPPYDPPEREDEVYGAGPVAPVISFETARPAAPPPPAGSPYDELAAHAAASERPSIYDVLAGTPPTDVPVEPADVEPRPPVDAVAEFAPDEPDSTVSTPPAPSPAPEARTEEPAPVSEPVGEVGTTPSPEPASPPEIESTPAADALDAPPWSERPATPALDEGRFALGGWAASAGHSLVSAVTFRRRLPVDVTADQIELDVEAVDNVPEGGLVVLADPGFAPDRDGFTLFLAAADPGPFSAAGSYRVRPPD